MTAQDVLHMHKEPMVCDALHMGMNQTMMLRQWIVAKIRMQVSKVDDAR